MTTPLALRVGYSPSGPRWEQTAPALHLLLPLPRRRYHSPRPPFIHTHPSPPPTTRRTDGRRGGGCCFGREAPRAAGSTPRWVGEYAWLRLLVRSLLGPAVVVVGKELELARWPCAVVCAAAESGEEQRREQSKAADAMPAAADGGGASRGVALCCAWLPASL
nr:unnamed protein product [Digitaria exilis]